MRKAEIKSRFDEIVDFAGVERYIDTPVKRYSSGMYVRLAFGVAAHLESEILVVDEVLAVGDAEFQKKCLGKMSDVSRGEGRTVLFVSHNMAAVKTLCRSGIVLKNGMIAKNDQIDIAIESYLKENDTTLSLIEKEIDRSKKGQFLTIKLFDENGKNNNTFLSKSNPYIEIEYLINDDYKNFNVGMILKDIFETHIYSTADTDLNTDLLNRKKGTYKASIPLNIFNLNTGSYKIQLLLGIIDVDLFDSVEMLFYVENDKFINTGKRAGLLVPIIEWKY